MFNSKFGIGVLKHPGYNGKGDPPAPAPTTSTSYSTNVPEYAEPYVMNMLNAAQAQIYNPSMTGFNQYTPYSNNPADYVAAASPMQQQAYSTAANMRVPGQYGMATGATMGALSGLGGVGQQMGNAGMNYAMQATNPYATQAYMNPYLQASLAPQLQLANQQYDIAGQKQQSTAAQQGAFGGSREALMAGLNRQNQMLAQNQLIGQGYNRAFDAAQQAQQFGANLGLQGQQGQMQALQAMLGGANQLAGIGGAQLAAQQGIAGLQNQYGQQQQQQQQNIINQAVQNYATAQQYPFMQLGLLNSMLRGLPMQQSSTQMYQAPPNPLSTIAGLGATAYGLFGGGAGGKKSGGIIKAAGGIPMSRFNQEQLNKVQKSPYSTPLAKVVATGELGLQNYIKANPEAKQLFASQTPPQMPPQQMPSPQQMAMLPQNRAGLDNIATDDMTQMAGGGIIAFADEGAVPPVQDPTTDWFKIDPKTKEKSFDIDKFLFSQATSKVPSASEAIKEDIKTQKQALADAEKTRERNKWLNVGSALLQSKSPFWQVGAGEALGAYTKSEEDAIKDTATRQAGISKLIADAAEKDEASQYRMIGLAISANASQENAKLRADQLKYNNAFLQNDKENKNAQLAINQFEKNRADYIKEQTKIAQANLTEIDPLKLDSDAYRYAYQSVVKSPIGKYLTTYTAPDERDVIIGYKPAPGANVVAPGTPPKPGASPAPAPGPAPFKYDPNTGQVIPGGGSSVFHF
jgi:hypothetical protein